MAYKRLENYGLIGDMRTAALVGRDGSIDWMCLPDFDSPSVFSKLLDDDNGGFFQISEPDLEDQRQIYFPDTNVLITRFSGESSVAQVADFMPVFDVPSDSWEHSSWEDPTPIPEGHTRLVRHVRGILGNTRMTLRCRPAFDYGRESHTVERTPAGAMFISESGKRLALSIPCDYEIRGEEVYAEFLIGPEEAITFSLEMMGPLDRTTPSIAPGEGERLFKETVNYWRDWVSHCTYQGRWRETVIRSLLTLKLLTYGPTGAIIAAPTTSLPERIGGARNWDYRYCWIRDAALTMEAFMRTGYQDEARRFMWWLAARARERNGTHPLQIMYGVRGERDLGETVLDHMPGYRDSKPVRIGNAAYKQLQLDMYGELMESVSYYNRFVLPISYDLWIELSRILDWVAEHWNEPDEGIWEVRGGRRQFVHSKLMAWNALARGLRLAEERSLPAPRDRWIAARDAIFMDIMDKGWNRELRSFVQSYGSDVLDASLLQLVNIGALSPRDPRMISTIAAIERRLSRDSLVYRYDPAVSAPDGYGDTEGTFTMCTFWLVEALTRSGRLQDARFLFERMLSYASPLGLYAEETGPTGEMLGNFPQAFTHMALVNSAVILDRQLNRAGPYGQRI